MDDQPEAFQEARDLGDILPVFWRYGPPSDPAQEEEPTREAGKEKEGSKKGEGDRPTPPTTIWEKLKV